MSWFRSLTSEFRPCSPSANGLHWRPDTEYLSVLTDVFIKWSLAPLWDGLNIKQECQQSNKKTPTPTSQDGDLQVHGMKLPTKAVDYPLFKMIPGHYQSRRFTGVPSLNNFSLHLHFQCLRIFGSCLGQIILSQITAHLPKGKSPTWTRTTTAEMPPFRNTRSAFKCSTKNTQC